MATAKAKPTEKKAPKQEKHDLVAVIRIRGLIGLKTSIADTLSMLKLFKKNHCIVIANTPQMAGMLNKIKDYVTYGEVDQATLALLEQKRKKLPFSSAAISVYALSPPRGGFERKGIKSTFSQGGVLGYRGSKINSLISKMV